MQVCVHVSPVLESRHAFFAAGLLVGMSMKECRTFCKFCAKYERLLASRVPFVESIAVPGFLLVVLWPETRASVAPPVFALRYDFRVEQPSRGSTGVLFALLDAVSLKATMSATRSREGATSESTEEEADVARVTRALQQQDAVRWQRTSKKNARRGLSWGSGKGSSKGSTKAWESGESGEAGAAIAGSGAPAALCGAGDPHAYAYAHAHAHGHGHAHADPDLDPCESELSDSDSD